MKPKIAYSNPAKDEVWRILSKELWRRCVVEPIIGHLKTDHHLGRNFLKGIQGGQAECPVAWDWLQLPSTAQVIQASCCLRFIGLQRVKKTLAAMGKTCRQFLHPSTQEWAF